MSNFFSQAISDIKGKLTKEETGNAKEIQNQQNEVQDNAILNWKKTAVQDGFTVFAENMTNMWDSACEEIASKAIIMKRKHYAFRNLTRIVQKNVGVKPDGLCGDLTDKAIRTYQAENGLVVDGKVGINTWKCMLGAEGKDS